MPDCASAPHDTQSIGNANTVRHWAQCQQDEGVSSILASLGWVLCRMMVEQGSNQGRWDSGQSYQRSSIPLYPELQFRLRSPTQSLSSLYQENRQLGGLRLSLGEGDECLLPSKRFLAAFRHLLETVVAASALLHPASTKG